MGWTPQQIDRMSLWEFLAAQDGFVRSRGGGAPDRGREMSEDRMRQLGLL